MWDYEFCPNVKFANLDIWFIISVEKSLTIISISMNFIYQCLTLCRLCVLETRPKTKHSPEIYRNKFDRFKKRLHRELFLLDRFCKELPIHFINVFPIPNELSFKRLNGQIICKQMQKYYKENINIFGIKCCYFVKMGFPGKLKLRQI